MDAKLLKNSLLETDGGMNGDQIWPDEHMEEMNAGFEWWDNDQNSRLTLLISILIFNHHAPIQDQDVEPS